jgi:hypothetical protein
VTVLAVSEAVIFALRREKRIRKWIGAKGRLTKRQPCGIERHRHVGQHPLQALEFGDRPSESLRSFTKSWTSQTHPARARARPFPPTRALAAVALPIITVQVGYFMGLTTRAAYFAFALPARYSALRAGIIPGIRFKRGFYIISR